MSKFRDRHDAGRRLARELSDLAGEDPVVLGLPRGGVPVAYEVATALGAPLDVIVVRKLGVPFQPEFGMGALGEGGVRVVNDDIVRRAQVTPAELATVEAHEQAEVARRAQRFRPHGSMVRLEGRTAIIVDDGLATGGTARAAIQVARAHGAKRVVLAVPVAPPDTARALATEADLVVVLSQPASFMGVGAFYDDFTQTSDEEVVALLTASQSAAAARIDDPTVDEDVIIPGEGVELRGHLALPDGALGVVVFAHGSGSGRLSPRNRWVARELQRSGLGTLLFDLLTDVEATDRSMVFDVGLLARRLGMATAWLRSRPEVGDLPVGYFGASTGAAAALIAAADPQSSVDAVVSRGGRPDLATGHLARVTAPTLLIVGGNDQVVLGLNREAAQELRCAHELAIVPGATHLFEEPGTLGQVAELAARWFVEHLARVTARRQQ